MSTCHAPDTGASIYDAVHDEMKLNQTSLTRNQQIQLNLS